MKEFETNNHENTPPCGNGDDAPNQQGRRETVNHHQQQKEYMETFLENVDDEIAAADADVQAEILNIN
jgi:hypothetical protein